MSVPLPELDPHTFCGFSLGMKASAPVVLTKANLPTGESGAVFLEHAAGPGEMAYLEGALGTWKCPLGEIRQRGKSGKECGLRATALGEPVTHPLLLN